MKIVAKLKQMIPWEVKSFLKENLVAFKMKQIMPIKQDVIDSKAEGINLIGSFKAQMGLGQSCRLVARELAATGVPLSFYNVGFEGRLSQDDDTYDAYMNEELPYRVNIFHVNPCELGKLVLRKPWMWENHYNIAFWLWELEEFPKEWHKYCDLFDEIWTPSDFAGCGVKKITDRPVKTLPYRAEVPVDEKYTRKSFGLPENMFLYLMMYDLNSTNSRKNPQGVLEAYKKAFPEERKDCGIVIKVNNATEKNMKMLRAQLSGYRNVFLITEIMDKTKVNSLIKCVDVFVSLHRAEGFGLVMAEAMLLGTPVIATNWSSNTEFMSRESACMVDYTMTTIKKREGLYQKGYCWAEPDIRQAGGYMRKLFEDKAFYREKRDQGKHCIDKMLGEDRIQKLWEKAIHDLAQDDKKLQ